MDDDDARTPWAVWPGDSRMPLDEAAMALDAGTSDNRLTVAPTEEQADRMTYDEMVRSIGGRRRRE